MSIRDRILSRVTNLLLSTEDLVSKLYNIRSDKVPYRSFLTTEEGEFLVYYNLVPSVHLNVSLIRSLNTEGWLLISTRKGIFTFHRSRKREI
jgi:hypothetical protein